MTKVQEQLWDYCLAIVDNPRSAGINNPDRRHNIGPALYEIFVWQEISALADKRLKEAWEAAAEEGVVKSDDDLRKLGKGEHIVTESNSFSVLAKVSAPRKTLDKDAFLEAVARKARISKEAVEILWEKHTSKEGKAPLEKRVLEV